MAYAKNIMPHCEGEYQDADFWPENPLVTSSQAFLSGAIPEATLDRACLLRDKFLEDLSALTDES
jgi:hypothetical protein